VVGPGLWQDVADELVPFGSWGYLACLSILLLARGADFLSTWIATPGLVLEGNPIAKRLGWRWGTVVNVVICVTFAGWPLAAVMVATTSVLVAARNFQVAWLMRSWGEENYQQWYVSRLRETSVPLYLVCLAGQTFLTAAVGAVLMYGYEGRLIPLAVGLGLIGYAVAVLLYTTLAFWRIRRA
jgi:hypothetical protein